ncbi:hypothetical protein WJ58_09890 [Burkholderia ubonensis]|uniref:hypothetical protein n=1 Tax=Burkholderia ubonensis TaxID=101571 RepID=UPI0007583635|nr:hypothetical protein [Burkholderia ubonensis]KVM59112.1 hypothetical protein WJ58_09890 [Burkholderia ubonensis]
MSSKSAGNGCFGAWRSLLTRRDASLGPDNASFPHRNCVPRSRQSAPMREPGDIATEIEQGGGRKCGQAAACQPWRVERRDLLPNRMQVGEEVDLGAAASLAELAGAVRRRGEPDAEARPCGTRQRREFEQRRREQRVVARNDGEERTGAGR